MTNELNLPLGRYTVSQHSEDEGRNYELIDRESDASIADIDTEANAAYICKAVNMFPELVSMLEQLAGDNEQAKQLLERTKE